MSRGLGDVYKRQALSLTISDTIKPQPISLTIRLNALLQIPAIGAKTTLFFISTFPILTMSNTYIYFTKKPKKKLEKK